MRQSLTEMRMLSRIFTVTEEKTVTVFKATKERLAFLLGDRDLIAQKEKLKLVYQSQ